MSARPCKHNFVKCHGDVKMGCHECHATLRREQASWDSRHLCQDNMANEAQVLASKRVLLLLAVGRICATATLKRLSHFLGGGV